MTRTRTASELLVGVGPKLNRELYLPESKPYPRLNLNKLHIFLALGSRYFANNAKILIGQKI